MANYYDRNPWSNHGSYYAYSSSYSNYNASSFYHHSNPNPRNPTPGSTPTVVSISIPAHPVNSESPVMPSPQRTRVPAPVAEPLRLSAEMAVTRLQKLMRGFLVRKNLKSARKIKAEAGEIDREIVEKEDILENNEKDRVRIAEMLMRLLLKLDSVRGVRDYRKKVIKRVISLQEKVDSIGTRDNKEDNEKDEYDPIEMANSYDSIAENHDSLEAEENKTEETINSVAETPIDDDLDLNLMVLRKIEVEAEEIELEIIEKEEVLERDEKDRIRINEMLMRLLFKLDSVRGMRDYRKKVIKRIISLQEKVDSIGTVRDSNEETDKMEETVNSIDEAPIEADFDLNLMEETPIEHVEPSKTVDIDKFIGAGNTNHKEELDENVRRLNIDGELDEQGPQSSSNEMEMKRLRKAMERMFTESQKTKTLMEEICQRNVQQWRLMEGLVNRVHRLERTVEKMEKKHKQKKEKINNKKENCDQWNQHF